MYAMQINDVQLKKGHEIQDRVRGEEGREGRGGRERERKGRGGEGRGGVGREREERVRGWGGEGANIVNGLLSDSFPLHCPPSAGTALCAGPLLLHCTEQ